MPCPRRSCGNSWSYSWGQPTVTYYQQPSGGCGTGGGGGSSSGGSGSGNACGGPPKGPDDFQGSSYEYGLYCHNWYRRRHGAPPHALSDRLNKAADAYSAKLCRMRTLVHSTGNDYGENLFMTYTENISKKEAVRQACKGWYDEVKLYSFGSGGFSMATGHFTAMVWKSSTLLGIGVCSGNGVTVVTGCYKVFPNMMGEFQSNVLQYRNVDDTDDEDSSEEEQEPEPEVKKKEAGKTEAAAPSKSKHSDPEIPKEAKDYFTSIADANGTIGSEELLGFLGKIDVAFKFEGFDKLISSLLISVATPEKKRVDLEGFKTVLKCVEGALDAYGQFDKDGSGTLDPFELKEALAEAGFNVSYKMFQILHSVLGTEGLVMTFRGYLLAFLLLTKLQGVQIEREKKRAAGGFLEDFSFKEWIQEQVA